MTPSTDLSGPPVSSTGNGADPEFEQALAEVLAAAIGYHHANEIDDAEALYKVILEAQPAQPDASHNLGVIALQRGEFERAIGCFEAAIGASPDQSQYWASYVNALNQSGQTSAAWVALELAQQRGMKGPAVDTLIQQMVQGVAAQARHEAVEQTAAIQMAAPDADSATAASVPAARTRKELSPVPPQQQINRLTALYNQGRIDEALDVARVMTARFPAYPLGWRAIGTALHSQGKIPESLAPLRRAVELAPKDQDARKVLADCLRLVGEYAEAEAECRTIISQTPAHGEAHRILGITLLAIGQVSEAEAYCRKAVELMPNSDVAYSTLGVMLLDQGKLADAEAQFRRSLEIKPDAPISHENILFCLSHNEEVTPEALHAQHLQFGEQCESPLRHRWKKHLNARKPDRQLRVGFVSGDFYQHAVSTFVEPVLAHLARDPSVSIHVYYNNSIADEVNAQLRRHVEHWNSIPGMTDTQLAEKIRADGIDILIDLSGHTAHNRLLTFARKPAPIQASWMGYPGTTGLRAMDYYFADAWHVPMEFADGQFIEKIAHLPANAPFQPATLAPPVNGLPALHNGFLTFGSFNRVSKLRPAAIVLWSRLLRALPDSRMVLGAMPRDANVDTLIQWFANEGISRERLDFRTRSSIPVYLQQHHHVDICLDTFPYAGGTTTLHAMWMGVPTLTLPGRMMPSRGSTAALAMAGLDGFIAMDSDDFVAKGLAWAADLPALAALRAGMRERCATSPMFQPEVIAAGFSDALREMWRRWCADAEPAPIESPVRAAAQVPPSA